MTPTAPSSYAGAPAIVESGTVSGRYWTSLANISPTHRVHIEYKNYVSIFSPPCYFLIIILHNKLKYEII